MNIDIIYEHNATGEGWHAIFEKYSKYCVENLKDIDVQIKNSVQLRGGLAACRGKYGTFFMSIVNRDTKKYIVISYWDLLLDILRQGSGFDLENCVEIITSSGTHKGDVCYTPINFDYTPFSYHVGSTTFETEIDRVYNLNVEKTHNDRLKFRGYLYQLRNFLSNDTRFDVIDATVLGQYKNYNDFVAELASNTINLSLNGAAEICYRDMQILGLGNALFRFELTTKFHNPLIPNHHYISVPHIDIKPDLQNYDVYCKKLGDRLFDRFEQVKNQHDFIKFVADNGRRWYLENGTVDANVKLLTQLVDFTKLK
jgi:hypothetical protein